MKPRDLFILLASFAVLIGILCGLFAYDRGVYFETELLDEYNPKVRAFLVKMDRGLGVLR